ncbi:MAG TPA: hypothetical protein VHL11_23415 [Phototrophicaceae bacterium]|jgi:hypothetical protein|nr:hypothetical protein [Phototrophicaceae bacterium]
MAQNTMQADRKHEMLSWVREGTPVFGRDGSKIGKVKYIHQGDMYDQGLVSKPDELQRLVPEIQIRLAQNGFVQINRGFFARDRFATPEQVEELDDEGLKLNVNGDELAG